jgi:DNA repair protein SbcC/Rad50
MRLHRLQIKAFGPFAGVEVVDFDALGHAGLFLLHGQTGAGKSSVLDAVCYALYGRVPGARGAVRPHLRSDHAPETERAEVRLEFTVGNRRLEVTRSPEWQRPKRRGEGTTSEKGSVALRERTGDRWETVTTRADELGLQMQDLLGMRLDQFTKVVLLPQGEFAAFLRADAESRRSLLQQLFSTGRFADVETWLAERRRDLGREVGQVRARSDELLARADEHVAQLTGAPPPDKSASTDTAESTPSTPAGRLRSLAIEASELAESSAEAAEAATAHAEASRSALTAGRELAARQATVATLAARAAGLLAAEPEQDERRRLVAAARRAAPLVPHLVTIARLGAERDTAGAALESARLDVPADLASAGRLAIESSRMELGKELGRLSDAREVRDSLAEQTTALAELTGLATAATRSAAAATDQLAAAEQRHTATLARLDQLTAAASGRTAAEASLAEAERVHRALKARTNLQAVIDQDEARLDDLRRRALELKEAWLSLRERRLAGMAAELSARLVDGADCPVCGATEHPRPAPSHDNAITKDAEEEAQDESFNAEQLVVKARESLASLRASLAENSERAAGTTVKANKTAITAAKAELAAADDAAARLPLERDALKAIAGQCTELTELARQFRESAVAHSSSAQAAIGQVRRLTTRLEKLRGADADIDSREARVQSELAALGVLLAALDRHEHLTGDYQGALAESETAYRAAGFADAGAAAAAVILAEPLTDLESLMTAHDEQVAAVTLQLQDPALLAAAQAEAPDLAVMLDAETADALQRRQAEQQHARVESSRVALNRLAGELEDHEEQSQSLLGESALVDDLARCVEGSGGDNVLRMRLSSYVLAARLEEVAAAATERLQVMSDGRYSLVHTDALARGGVRSGLGLRVVDGWTGVERDTATLSGGESFLASLALALGLADAVQAEAGGALMQTLFIDEGFGMLDEETLDEVMTVLDGLRAGGRSVGLVSHVADLRARIPAQLEVRKSRVGSRIVAQDAGAA